MIERKVTRCGVSGEPALGGDGLQGGRKTVIKAFSGPLKTYVTIDGE